MIPKITDRLDFDPEQDLRRLLEFWDEVPGTPSLIKPHFEIAKKKPDVFFEHGPALAISIGGSTTKKAIAAMHRGQLVIKHAQADRNPSVRSSLTDYFDKLILADAEVHRYLKSSERPCVFVSIPVPIKDGVPYHVSKVETIDGLIARDYNRDASSHHFGNNFREYLKSRNIPIPRINYFCDGVVAHHGGVAIGEVFPEDKSVLLVCGTGLATSDEEKFIITGQAPLLDHDEELYPYTATEGYQYQWCAAGKGLFGTMQRAIQIVSKQPGSALSKHDLNGYFQKKSDTLTVAQIWWSTLEEGLITGTAQKIYQSIGPEAYSELQFIARKLMERCISIMANSAVATLVKLGPNANNRGHVMFFEVNRPGFSGDQVN